VRLDHKILKPRIFEISTKTDSLAWRDVIVTAGIDWKAVK